MLVIWLVLLDTNLKLKAIHAENAILAQLSQYLIWMLALTAVSERIKAFQELFLAETANQAITKIKKEALHASLARLDFIKTS